MTTSTAERVGTGLAVMPCVNLLPPEIRLRRRMRTVRTACGGGVVAAIAIVAVAAVLAAAGTQPAQQQVDAAHAQQATLQQQAGSYGTVTATYDKAGQVDQLLSTVSQGEIHWSTFLNDLASNTPKTVWLKTVSVSSSTATVAGPAAGTAGAGAAAGVATISFEGVALSHNNVATWLESLARTHGYSDPYFSKSDEQQLGGKTVYAFTSTVTVNQQALQSAAGQGGN